MKAIMSSGVRYMIGNPMWCSRRMKMLMRYPIVRSYTSKGQSCRGLSGIGAATNHSQNNEIVIGPRILDQDKPTDTSQDHEYC